MEKISLDRIKGEKPKITRIAKSMPRIIIATQLYKSNVVQYKFATIGRLLTKSHFSLMRYRLSENLSIKFIAFFFMKTA